MPSCVVKRRSETVITVKNSLESLKMTIFVLSNFTRNCLGFLAFSETLLVHTRGRALKNQSRGSAHYLPPPPLKAKFFVGGFPMSVPKGDKVACGDFGEGFDYDNKLVIR